MLGERGWSLGVFLLADRSYTPWVMNELNPDAGHYSLFDVLGAGLFDMEPLTEEELGATYDQMAVYNAALTDLITREEFINNSLSREAEILEEDLRSLLPPPKDRIDFNEYS